MNQIEQVRCESSRTLIDNEALLSYFPDPDSSGRSGDWTGSSDLQAAPLCSNTKWKRWLCCILGSSLLTEPTSPPTPVNNTRMWFVYRTECRHTFITTGSQIPVASWSKSSSVVLGTTCCASRRVSALAFGALNRRNCWLMSENSEKEPAWRLQTKDIQFTVIILWSKQTILKLEKLEPANIFNFSSIND